MTKEEYGANLDVNVENLIGRMKNQNYKPQPVRRVYIPKDGSNEKRPLGIPAYEDKLVQKVISEILARIYEPIFKDYSYGFRPRKSCHDAIKALNRIIEENPVSYIVDADIKGFFNNVNHEWMIKFLEHRIEDENLIRIIHRLLKAGVMDKGEFVESDLGTPQGGNCSPILANIYLHYVLDMWFDIEIKKKSKGKAYIVRYADDCAPRRRVQVA